MIYFNLTKYVLNNKYEVRHSLRILIESMQNGHVIDSLKISSDNVYDYYLAKDGKVIMLMFDYEEYKRDFIMDIFDICVAGDSFDVHLYDDEEYGVCYGSDKVFPINELIEVEGYKYSESYLEDSDEFTMCQHCSEWHRTDRGETVHTDGYTEWWCYDCAHEHATQCEDCGEWFENCDVTSINDGDYYVCDDCREDYYRCDACGGWYSSNRGGWQNGEWMCDDCYNDNDVVRSYHNNPTLRKHIHDLDRGEDGTCFCFIGSEIETEKGDEEERKSITWDEGDEERYIYQMHDGSLDDSGIECITQPMSYNFWKEFPFERWMNRLTDAGARAHDTQDCGLHIHLSREWINDGGKYNDMQLAIVGRIRQFLADNTDMVKCFARRSEERWCQYTKPFGDKKELEGKSDDEKNQMYKDKVLNGSTDRYQALNNCNSNTIEFRIFRGTLNPNTYRASVEFCLRVVDYIKTHPDDVVSWNEFLTYKELPECMVKYLEQRHINIPNV